MPREESFARLGGLSWEQWSARLALPLVAGMRVAPPPAPGEPAFTCPDCGRVYKLKSSLRNHQKWECGKEPQFQCPYCVYRAKQKMHIARHMERMHREVQVKHEQFLKRDNVDAFAQLYTPYILGYGTAGLSSGKVGWTLYECVDCGNKYKHKGSLQRHIKYECRKQPSFKCPYCVYRAYQKHNLLLHERHLHKDLPEKVDFVSE
ncbi:zinc finger protein 470-like [Melitaea cinxia]|uniref:zinc finger protein 470-like n=1 Tax=Melitaea cinxia TaxID=113334 RepID=UPI001E2721E3|nr:zinc finger protein 470-like [Melitaea cinxia]